MAEEGLSGTARTVSREAAGDNKSEGISYEALQDLVRAERRSNKLTPLPPRHWIQVREFLQAVTDAFRLEQARDPFGRKVMRLTDEVKNARHAAEAVWALRERKLAMLALAATKERKQPDGITPEEAELYRRMLDGLDASRAKVFEGLLPDTGPLGPLSGAPAAPAPVPPAEPRPMQVPLAPIPIQAVAAPVATAAAASGPSTHVVPADTKAAHAEMVTIRALGDIPPFVGPDMQTYLLKAGDIATVPPSIANLLVRRNKAAVVDAP